CAILMTPRRPTIIERPSAISAMIQPPARPLLAGTRTTSRHCVSPARRARSRILHYSPTDPAAPGSELNRRKRYALALLAAITLATPIVETLMTGRVEPFSNFDLGGSFLSLLPIYWWYHLDKDQTGYRAGPLLNVGVAALAIVALPVYFVRSRGWKRGGIICLYALGAVGVLYLLETLGGFIGEAIAGMGGGFT